MNRRNIAGSLAIVAIAVAVMFARCVEEETPTKVPETTTPPAETPTLAPEVPTELSLNIGETAKTSKIEVTLKSIERVDYYEWYSDIVSQYYTQSAPEGKIYLLADIEIKNTGSDRVYVGSSEFSVTDSEGFRYDPELYLDEDGLEMFKELYQNQKMKGKILFEIPEEAKGLKLQYDFGSLFTGVKLASWNLD
jgi:hypothetical protein